jgi:hypothetical protein
LIPPAEKECVGTDHERTNTQLSHCCKNAIEVGRGAGMQEMKPNSEFSSRRLGVFRRRFGKA